MIKLVFAMRDRHHQTNNGGTKQCGMDVTQWLTTLKKTCDEIAELHP